MSAEQVQQARQAAVRRLREASMFAKMHAAGPLLNRRQGTGKVAVLVRLEWPGVLRVIDPQTGRELARSKPGSPAELAHDFDPLAALTGKAGA